jgi:hypothetical protein
MISLNSDFRVFGCLIHRENDKTLCSPVVSQIEMHGFHGSTEYSGNIYHTGNIS